MITEEQVERQKAMTKEGLMKDIILTKVEMIIEDLKEKQKAI